MSPKIGSGKGNTYCGEATAIAEMMRWYEIVRDMFHGFSYLDGLQGTAGERLRLLAEALNFILEKQNDDSAKENGEEEKKRANSRFQDAILSLSVAFALAVDGGQIARKAGGKDDFTDTKREDCHRRQPFLFHH